MLSARSFAGLKSLMDNNKPDKKDNKSLGEKAELAAEKLERRFKRTEEKLESAAETLEEKFELTEEKLESAAGALEERLEKAGQTLEAAVETVEQKLEALERRLTGREIRLERAYEGEAAPEDLIIETRGLKKYFPRNKERGARRDVIRAVDGVDLDIVRGETLGVVGESGCGKSTAARCLIGLLPPTDGSVKLYGRDLNSGDSQSRRAMRRHTGIIFQDPYGSLDPRMTVAEIVGEPLRAYKLAEGKMDLLLRALDMIEACGLQADDLFKFPHQFSGGQRQRICIARALIAGPDLVVCDEAVSALDVSIQAQIINLLVDLRETRDLTYAFISHDLEVVRFIADRVAVMYQGKIVEMARKDDLFSNPAHPYTVMLLESAPVFGRKAGYVDLSEIPELTPEEVVVGCRFRNRCPKAKDECAVAEPELLEVGKTHVSACRLK